MSRVRSARIPSIDDVRARFQEWRETRQGKARIPDELWSAAAAVARWNGVNRTAVALHLDGGKLKKRMVAAGVASKKTAPPVFLELMAPRTNGLPEYTIELERQGTLRIHCKGATAAELAALSRALWSVTS